MELSQISQTTAPFWPGVVGCPAFAAKELLPIAVIAFVVAGVTGLTDREGLFNRLDVLVRGKGVMEMLGCWLVLVLLTVGVVELWIVSPLVFTKPGSKLMELVLEAFFSLSIALAPADWFLDTFDGKTDIEDPCPCNSWKDLAIA